MSSASSFFAEVQEAKRRSADCPSPALLLTRELDVLPDAVRVALEAHLASCAWCRGLRDDLAALEPVELRAEERARIEARVFTAAATAPSPARSAGPRRGWSGASWSGAAALAATLLLAAVVTTSWQRETPVPPQAPPAPAMRVASFTAPSALRLDAPPVAVSLETALVWRGAAAPASANSDAVAGADAFARGDFAAAYDRLRRVPSNATSSDSLLYLGVSALFLNHDREAADALARARERSTANQRAAIDWYVGLTDVRAGRLDQARAALGRLCDTEGDYSLRACAAVLELDRRAR